MKHAPNDTKYKENPEKAKLSSEIWHRLIKKQYLCHDIHELNTWIKRSLDF